MTEIFSEPGREQRRPIWGKYIWAIFRHGFLAYFKPIINFRVNINYINQSTDFRVKDKKLREVTHHLVATWLTTANALYTGPLNATPDIENKVNWMDWMGEIRDDLQRKLADEHEKDIITTPLPIHFAIVFEVMSALLKPTPVNVDALRMIAIACIDIMPSALLERFLDELKCFEEYKTEGKQAVVIGDSHVMYDLFIYFFGVMSSIDWFELSKKPWKKLIEKQQTTSSLRGQGFAVV